MGGCVGWYEKICGERLLPAGAGREVVNDRKVWCSVKNQAGKVLAGCDRKGVCRLARMPGVWCLRGVKPCIFVYPLHFAAGKIRHIGYIKKIRKETKICLVRFVGMVFQLLMGMQ